MTTKPKEPLLAACADVLRNGRPTDRQPPQLQALLQALEYNESDSQQINHHRANLLHSASDFARFFQLRAPDAPGLTFFGAQVDPGTITPGGLGQRPLPASGVGLSFRAAFEGCIGEGVELLSQFECAGDIHVQAPIGDRAPTHNPALIDLLRQAHLPDDTVLDWMIARRVLDDEAVAIPADLCLRRGSRHVVRPPWPLSIGCAAGPSHEAAMLHGLLELIERDAAAIWWRGGRRGRLIPLDSETTRRTLDLLTPMRGATQRRRCWLLDITTDLAVPTVAAISVDQANSHFACGLAARLSLPHAAEAAILEMSQMELAHHVVATKQHESGDAGLNALDRAHLRRATELNPSDCALLHPLPVPPDPVLDIQTNDVTTALRQLLQHLHANGIETFMIDLTRPAFGIPVVRMISPMLEKEPSLVVGARLRSAIEETGGGGQYTGDIPLM